MKNKGGRVFKGTTSGSLGCCRKKADEASGLREEEKARTLYINTPSVGNGAGENRPSEEKRIELVL